MTSVPGEKGRDQVGTRASSIGHAADYNDRMTNEGDGAGGERRRPEVSVARHPRAYRENLYVYPVLSRRARGISIGINLNPDKVCNFDCIYCQVDRTTPAVVRRVDEIRLKDELLAILQEAKEGALFERPEFRETPPALRRLNDIAFSGDGEPTTFPKFFEAVQMAAA